MFTASIFFLGQFRPAYFEGETVNAACDKARAALIGDDDVSAWLRYKLLECAVDMKATKARPMPPTSMSIEYGARGASIRAGAHDPFLDHATRDFPAFPGLDYSDALNMRETV